MKLGNTNVLGSIFLLMALGFGFEAVGRMWRPTHWWEPILFGVTAFVFALMACALTGRLKDS